MLSQHRVVIHWLVVAAVSLLVMGVFTYREAVVTEVELLVVASTAVALLSVLFAGLQMRAEWTRRMQVEVELHDALASVEHQVEERTQALSRAMAELKLSDEARAAALSRAEDARRVAEEASHLKDEFLATASHELRTPLNAIVGWVHVLQSGAVVDDHQRTHAISAIDRNARIQTRLIEDLLDVSRMIKGHVSLTVAPVAVAVVVAAAIDTIKPAAAAKDIAVDLESQAEPLLVIGDEHRLQQVVWNLLANAVKYTPRGGRIRVAIANAGGRATISVKDSGEGIEPGFLPYVFESFRQGASAATMRSGMGLGLAVVRLLVDLHGGRVTAASAGRGQGSEFVVSLPASGRPAV
jgi:signal transduction histidine kinase